MTSRFRDIENNVEAQFSLQQRRLLSEITSESAQVLEPQRHTLVQEATTTLVHPGATVAVHNPARCRSGRKPARVSLRRSS